MKDTAAGMEIVVTDSETGQKVSLDQSINQVYKDKNIFGSVVTIPDPKLWYPNDLGSQPTYQVDLRVIEAQTAQKGASDTAQIPLALRDIQWKTPPGMDDKDSRVEKLHINGIPLFLKGVNIVPTNIFYENNPAMLSHVVRLMKEAHVNAVRLWGGAPMPNEREGLFRLCREAGILTWDEAPQSSSGMDHTPPKNHEYVSRMVKTVDAMMKEPENDAVIICGGNELHINGGKPHDEKTSPVLHHLQNLVSIRRPDALWFPTSPSGPADEHGQWHYQGVGKQEAVYNKKKEHIRLLSEAGVQGMANAKTIESRFPDNAVGMEKTFEWQWWFGDGEVFRKSFGNIDELQTKIQATQFFQHQGVKYLLESMRQEEHKNVGVFLWQLNEPYPNLICTNVIDAYGRPKPAYYGMKKAYEPVHVAAEFSTSAFGEQDSFNAKVFASNSTSHEIADAKITQRLVGASGSEYFSTENTDTITAASGRSVEDLSVPMNEISEEVFFLDLSLQSDTAASNNRYVFTKGNNYEPLLKLPKTSLNIAKERLESGEFQFTITNTGKTAALNVELDDTREVTAGQIDTPPATYFSENYFHLLPSEKIHVTVASEDEEFSVKGWNTDKSIV